MSGERASLGARGEELARLHAEARGCRTLARNVRTPFGEIDLVLEDDRGTIIFAEVKTRTGRGYGEAAEAVTSEKCRRLRRAALAYCQKTGRSDPAMRFDVFAVSLVPGKDAEVEHIPDAF